MNLRRPGNVDAPFKDSNAIIITKEKKVHVCWEYWLNEQLKGVHNNNEMLLLFC